MSAKLDCPVCGETVTFTIDPGEPMVTSGPSDSWYPGYPPSAEIDQACRCIDSDFVDYPKLALHLETLALESVAWDDDDGDARYEAWREERETV